MENCNHPNSGTVSRI